MNITKEQFKIMRNAINISCNLLSDKGYSGVSYKGEELSAILYRGADAIYAIESQQKNYPESGY